MSTFSFKFSKGQWVNNCSCIQSRTVSWVNCQNHNWLQLCKVFVRVVSNDLSPIRSHVIALQWRHNEHGDVSNHQPHVWLLNRSFRRRSNKTSKRRVTGVCVWNRPLNSPHKAQATRNIFPFDDVIIWLDKLIHLPVNTLKNKVQWNFD